MKQLLIMLLLLSLVGCGLFRSRATDSQQAEIVQQVIEQVEAHYVAANIIVARSWWLVPGAIVGIAGSAGLLIAKQYKLGLMLGVTCGVLLILSVTVFAQFAMIGWIGLAIGLVALGLAGYWVWMQRRVIIPQLIATTEAAKERLPVPAKSDMFDVDGIADMLQTDITKAVVADERGK